MGKWNTEKFKEYVYDNFGDEFTVLGEYVNNGTKIEMRHSECGRNFEIVPGNFKMRKRCPLCNGTFKKSTDDFRAEVEVLVGSEYEVHGEYKTAKDNIRMRHAKCGSFYFVTPTDFLSGGNRCPECAPNKKKDTAKFKAEVRELAGHEYEVVGEYTGSKVRVEFKHNVCGTTFMKTPELFLIGHRCPECGLTKRSGVNHYKYNPDLTDEERSRRDMYNGEIRKWRDKVYSRDDYTCKACNERGRRLNAHHIESWDICEEGRFDVSNGVTLCIECHKRFHMEFGYGSNTKMQFNEFLATL